MADLLRLKQEFLYQEPNPGLWVDEEAGIVYGVWICGLEGTNQASRIYPPEVLDRDKGLYDGSWVNLNHLQDDNSYRPFQDRFGWIEQPYCQPNGLYGNLKYNQDHPEAKAFVWWVRHNPKAIGLSHDIFYEKTILPNGRVQVTRILQVNGVDIVAKPSTTTGLKEGVKELDTNLQTVPDELNPSDEHYTDHVGKCVAAIMQDADLSMEEKKKKILTALKLMEDESPEPADEKATEDDMEDAGGGDADEDDTADDDDSEAMEALKEVDNPKVKAFLKKLDSREAQSKVARAKEAAKSRCLNLKLPKQAISDLFIEDLIQFSPDDQTKRIMERKALVAGKTGAISTAREAVLEKTQPKKGLPPVKDLLKLAAQEAD